MGEVEAILRGVPLGGPGPQGPAPQQLQPPPGQHMQPPPMAEPSTVLYLGIETPPEFNAAARIQGPGQRRPPLEPKRTVMHSHALVPLAFQSTLVVTTPVMTTWGLITSLG